MLSVIPAGWALVPLIPTERMLNEFSGVWWPNCDSAELTKWAKDKRLLEEQAYAAMILAAPSPPVSGDSEIDSLRKNLLRKNKVIRAKDAEINKAYKKLKYAFDKLRATEAKLAERDALLREALGSVHADAGKCENSAIVRDLEGLAERIETALSASTFTCWTPTGCACPGDGVGKCKRCPSTSRGGVI